MQKAIQIAYNDMFVQKCAYAAQAGFQHIRQMLYDAPENELYVPIFTIISSEVTIIYRRTAAL